MIQTSFIGNWKLRSQKLQPLKLFWLGKLLPIYELNKSHVFDDFSLSLEKLESYLRNFLYKLWPIFLLLLVKKSTFKIVIWVLKWSALARKIKWYVWKMFSQTKYGPKNLIFYLNLSKHSKLSIFDKLLVKNRIFGWFRMIISKQISWLFEALTPKKNSLKYGYSDGSFSHAENVFYIRNPSEIFEYPSKEHY